MGSLHGIRISKYARQTTYRAIERHGSVGAPHNVFCLLAKPPFLRAARHLIPHGHAAPDPSGPLQRVRHAGILPPIDKKADRRARLAGFAHIAQPLRHPTGPASLVAVIPVKIRQCLFLPHATVFLYGRAVLLTGLGSSTCIGRIRNHSIKHLRLESAHDAQHISVQDRPTIAARVLQRGRREFHNIVHFNVLFFSQSHHPFMLCICRAGHRFCTTQLFSQAMASP